MRGLWARLGAMLDDLLCVVGCGLIIYATAMLSVVAALYVAGAACVAAGVVIGLSRQTRTKT